MKNIINIHLSKDTPAETIKELHAILKLQKEKPTTRKQSDLYASNEDIEKLHERYEQLFKKVKNSPDLSEKQIEKECDTLSRKYDFELEELSKRRKVDYDKEQAEIEARAKEETPWRRGWWWKLIFQPLTNRAQDIIEERAELNAEKVHSAEEKANKDERNKLQTNNKKLSLRKRKREMKRKLNEVIKRADNADVAEMLTEPQGTEPPEEPEPAQTEPTATSNAWQLPGQMTMDEMQQQQPPTKSDRRPRPPRSCRKQ